VDVELAGDATHGAGFSLTDEPNRSGPKLGWVAPLLLVMRVWRGVVFSAMAPTFPNARPSIKPGAIQMRKT
jgi:hypothetical protein